MRRVRCPKDCCQIPPRFGAHIRRLSRKHKVSAAPRGSWYVSECRGNNLVHGVSQFLKSSPHQVKAVRWRMVHAEQWASIVLACKGDAFTQCLALQQRLSSHCAQNLTSSVLFLGFSPAPCKGQALAVVHLEISGCSSAEQCNLMTICQ